MTSVASIEKPPAATCGRVQIPTALVEQVPAKQLVPDETVVNPHLWFALHVATAHGALGQSAGVLHS